MPRVSVRLALVPVDDDEGITVNRAARILGCDPSTVRKLLSKRRLAGWRVGAGDTPNGVRVSRQAVEAYKARHTIGGSLEADAPPPPKVRRPKPGAAHNEALAVLRSFGVNV